MDDKTPEVMPNGTEAHLAPDAVSTERALDDIPTWSRFKPGPLHQQVAEALLDAIAEGYSISSACKVLGIRPNDVLRHAAQDEEFALALQIARDISAEPIEERLQDIALNGDPNSVTTVRAAEILLKGKSDRYNRRFSTSTQVDLKTGGGRLRVKVGTPLP
jgi:hypothetical protein